MAALAVVWAREARCRCSPGGCMALRARQGGSRKFQGTSAGFPVQPRGNVLQRECAARSCMLRRPMCKFPPPPHKTVLVNEMIHTRNCL